jgi:hypothetical protein
MKTSGLGTASVQAPQSPQDAQVVVGHTSVNLQASALERGGSCQVRSVPKFLQFSLDLFSSLKNKNKKKKQKHVFSSQPCLTVSITKLLVHSCNPKNLATG